MYKKKGSWSEIGCKLDQVPKEEGREKLGASFRSKEVGQLAAFQIYLDGRFLNSADILEKCFYEVVTLMALC